MSPPGTAAPRDRVSERLEDAFESWGRLVFRRPWIAIGVMLVATLVPASQLPHVRIVNSIQGFLRSGDPTLRTYDAFRHEFGYDQAVVVGVEPPEVFDAGFLAELRRLHADLEDRVPHLDEILSLVNARWTRTQGDELVVGELLEVPPTTPREVEDLRRRVFSHPLYQNGLISADGDLTTITLTSSAYSSRGADEDALVFPSENGEEEPRRFLTDAENVEFLGAIRSVLAAYERPGLRTWVAGGPVVTERFDLALRGDVARFASLSFLASLAVLYGLFRNAAGVLLPMAVIVPSVLCTLGLMVLLEIPISISTEIVPSFLLVVGLCDSMHLLVIFYQRLHGGDSREDAIAGALRHSGLPILVTSLTTAGGLASFQAAELAPVAYFGVVAPLGVVLAFVFTIVLLPALLAVAPLRARAGRWPPPEQTRLGRALHACGDLATRRPAGVVAGTALFVLVCALGAAQLRFGQDELRWFPERDPLRTATQRLDRELGGVMNVEVLVRTGERNALYDPARLQRLERIAETTGGLRQGQLAVGGTVSIADVVKEVHRALHEDRPEYYAIPASREVVAQELLLFENQAADDLARLADEELRTARLTLRVPKVDAWLYPDFLRELRRRVRDVLGAGAEIDITGLTAIMGRVMAAVVASMARSYLVAFVVITPLMMIVVRSVRIGLLSMIPNLLPVLLVLGIMGWRGILLDAFSLLVGCIVIGLAVDDTIHFMHNYRRSHAEHGDVRAAVRKTLSTTGMAMLFTSLVLVAGCASFLFAYMVNIATLGMLVGLAIAAALLADVLLMPALMTLVARRRGAR